jgi:membrane-associated phospholipid phosphatase
MGTATPPGQWMRIAQGLVAERSLTTTEAAGVYAALGTALHDAAVACWESKYHYMFARPVQALRERGKTFVPLIKTPPHPSYPSGHASFSGAASAVLAAAFPDAAEQLRQQAEEAARSRVLGGIHWPIDSAAGLDQGAQVAARVLDRLER